jgi:hypothetical protein
LSARNYCFHGAFRSFLLRPVVVLSQRRQHDPWTEKSAAIATFHNKPHQPASLRGGLRPISHCFVQQVRVDAQDMSTRIASSSIPIMSLQVSIRHICRLLLSRPVFLLHGISSASRHHAYNNRQSVLHYNILRRQVRKQTADETSTSDRTCDTGEPTHIATRLLTHNTLPPLQHTPDASGPYPLCVREAHAHVGLPTS